MNNLLEIQNSLRSAPDQQLMSLMQGSNPSVPQWAVASELNSRKEMRMEQTRQEGLGQPTVIDQLAGNAPAPQANAAGIPQGVASGMAQSMAPKTDVTQNTGIASVAPVATMASGGIIKMREGGDPAEKTYTFIYPEGMNKPSFDLEISDSGAYNSIVKAIRELGGTIIEKDTGRVMQSDTAEKIIQESSDMAEADARVSKYVPSASDVYGKDSGRFTPENAAPENYGVSAGLPPVGGAMYSSPTGARGGSPDSSGLGLPTDEFSGVSLSAIPRPKGLATLGAAGDADMLDETVGVQTAPPMPSSPGIAAGTPFDTTKYTPRLPEKPITIDAAVPSSEKVTNAQLEAFTNATNLRNTALTAPAKPEVFDALEDIRLAALLNEVGTVDQILIDQIKKLRTPQEQAAAVKLAMDKHRAALDAVDAAQEKYEQHQKNDTDGTMEGRVAKDEYRLADEEIRRIRRAAPWASYGVKAHKHIFGPEVATITERQAAIDLQAKAVADAAEVTTAEPLQAKPTELSPADLTEYLSRTNSKGQPGGTVLTPKQQMENAKAVVADEADSTAAAGKNPLTNAYNVVMGNTAADSLDTDGPFMPNEDTRIKRMKMLVEQINSGELTGNALFSAQKTLERLRKGVARSGGEEELGRYLTNQITGGVKKALPYAVDTADYAVRNLGLGTLAGATLGPRAEGFLLDNLDAAQANTAGTAFITPTSANEIEAEAIVSAVPEGDLIGPKPDGSVSMGGVITPSVKEQAAITAAQGIDELSFLNNDSNAEVQRRAGLYRDSYTEQDAINAERARREAKVALATAVEPKTLTIDAEARLDAERAKGLTAGENAFVAPPAKNTGIAAASSSSSSSSSGSKSLYEQKLLDILKQNEESASKDKWLGLAEMGMRLMGSNNPSFLGAVGESGLGALGSYMGQQKTQDATELNILGKLNDMDIAKQTLQARRDIASATADAKANKPVMNFSQLGKYYEDRYDDALAAYSDVAPDTGPNSGNVSNDEVLRRRRAVEDAYKTVSGHYEAQGLRGPTLPFAAEDTMIRTNTGQ